MAKDKIKARLVEAGKYGEDRDQYGQRPSHRKDRAILFVWAKDEGAGLEQFIYRHNRPVQLYRTLLPEIFKKLGLPADTKARWSQKAGCTCPCSPGFILSHTEWRHDFYAYVTADDPEAVKHNGEIPEQRVRKAEELAAGGV
jgi:hypothetical protein